MSKLLVVVGATGSQGSAVIKWFKEKEPDWKIRGLTRNPSSEAAMALTTSGIEVVKADLNDIETLKSAFEGANYIFAYTDFAGILNSPEVMGKFKAGQLAAPLGAETFKIESKHGRNVADAAASVPSLERLVWSSLANVARWSSGKYTQCFHFDAKAVVTEYMLSLEALEGKVSMLQMGAFTTNVAKGLELFGFRITEDKTAVWEPPFPGTLPLPWVDVEKDTGAFVKVLIDAPAPMQVLAVSEWMTCKEFLDIWGSVTGLKTRFVESDSSRKDSDDPSGLKRQLDEASWFMEEFGFTGGDPDVLSPEDLEKKGHPIARSTVAAYISREDWSKLIG